MERRRADRDGQGPAEGPAGGLVGAGAAAPAARLIPPGSGEVVWLGGVGVRFLLDGAQTGGRFALVEHPLRPRALGAPLHTHHDEDEFSFVLEGEVGLQLGEAVWVAPPGSLVVKPRGLPHAFWNAGDAPARLLELISPAGFERYFAELAEVFRPGAPPALELLPALLQRYRLDLDVDSATHLAARHGLRAG
jgi:quercetin dioxygenase-like cupin family protein